MNSLLDSFTQALTSPLLSLEDSGAGERLERFGALLIRRPSSQALWQRRDSKQTWDCADSCYIPQKGWAFKKTIASDWTVELGEMTLKLLFQDNGQIGLFPEHLSYFTDISHALKQIALNKKSPARVLNLFAYTGAASVWCALHGAEVTHVELSKKVLSWAKENQELNPKAKGNIRFLPEDAVVFLEREAKRESHYDIIIADPPSFSRLSKSQTWDLEDIAAGLVSSMIKILNPQGAIFLSSHHPALNAYAFENLIRDLRDENIIFNRRDLLIGERKTSRFLPCGSLLIAHDQTQ